MESNFVDHVYVITASDRIKNFLKKYPFNKHNLTVITMITDTFDNIKVEDIDGIMNKKVAYSHKYICELALGKGYKKILVFEDDAELAPYYTPKKMKPVLDWIKNNDFDLYYLGHVPVNFQIIINAFTVKTLGSLESHAVCYSEKVMKLISTKMNITDSKFDLLKYKNDGNDSSIDNFLRIECKFLNAYACYPVMFYQNVHPNDVLNAIKAGIFPKHSIEHWSNVVSDAVISVSQIIMILIFIILFSLLISLSS